MYSYSYDYQPTTGGLPLKMVIRLFHVKVPRVNTLIKLRWTSTTQRNIQIIGSNLWLPRSWNLYYHLSIIIYYHLFSFISDFIVLIVPYHLWSFIRSLLCGVSKAWYSLVHPKIAADSGCWYLQNTWEGGTKGRWGHISQHFFAFILFQYIYISNFPLPPRCLSIACIHFVSYVDLPLLASPPLLTFLLLQYPNFPGINNFLHASCLNI